MPGMLELVDVRPDFRLPCSFVGGRFPTGCAPSVEADGRNLKRDTAFQLQKDAPHFLDFFVLIEQMLIPQQVGEAQFAGLRFGLDAGMKWAVLRPQLLSRVASHPERFFVVHATRPGSSSWQADCEARSMGPNFRSNFHADLRNP